jgi:predicted RNase H-like HicB family nuclease
MSQQVAHDAYVEVLDSGACRAQVSDLPGCFAVGQDVVSALMALAERIPAYYDWLRSHDEYTPMVAGPFRVEAKAVERVTGRYPNVTEAFFPSDATPVNGEDLDWLLALLEWSLDDLIHLGERIAPAQRETPTPTGPPPNALLRQAAEIQARYLVMLNARPDPRVVTLPDAPPLGQLREVRQVSLRRLRNTTEQDRQRIIEVQGERWSLRKILRCGILSARIYAEPLAAVTAE